MRIAVMGAGGVGGYFGGLLAKAGNEVTLIARGPHLEAIRTQGLQIKSQWGDFNVRVEATDDPRQIGPVELVLFSVKTYQNAATIPAMAPLVGESTSLLTLQNGVEGHKELGQVVGPERVLPGSAYIETHIESPGVLSQRGDVARIAFGETGGQRTPRARRILETFQASGIPTNLSTDVVKELWTKFLRRGKGTVDQVPLYMHSSGRYQHGPCSHEPTSTAHRGAGYHPRRYERGGGRRTVQRSQPRPGRGGEDYEVHRDHCQRPPRLHAYRPRARAPTGTGGPEWCRGEDRAAGGRSHAGE